MAKNDFLDKQRQRDRKFFDAGMMFGLQLSKDFHDISLTSESVMGEKVLTREDLTRVAENCSALDDYFHNAFTDHVEADHLQEQMDRLLREIYGDDLIPFQQRHPIVKQYDYVKSRKGWK